MIYAISGNVIKVIQKDMQTQSIKIFVKMQAVSVNSRKKKYLRFHIEKNVITLSGKHDMIRYVKA